MTTINPRRMSHAGLCLTAVLLAMWAMPTSPLVAQKAPRLNRMIEALESGQPALTGDTWAWIEQEHQPFIFEKLKAALDMQLSKRNDQGQVMLAPYVRIPTEGDESKRWIIKQVLEAGAMGIIIPRVDTAQQALEIAQDMRYAQPTGSKFPEPKGLRGCCATPSNWMLKNPHDYWEGGKGDLWPLNPAGELLALPMIESPDGVKNIGEILKVPGVAGVLIGTSDLNSRMNEGWVDPLKPVFGPKTEAAFQKVLSTCAAAKKYCGLPTVDEASTKKYIDMGARVIYKLYR